MTIIEKLKYIKLYISEHKIDIIIGYIFIIIIALIGIVIWTYASNASNKISEGTIIDKEYVEAHTSTLPTYINGSLFLKTEHYSEQFIFTIQGTKDGKTVEYQFEVTESEYKKYNIGDYYKK